MTLFFLLFKNLFIISNLIYIKVIVEVFLLTGSSNSWILRFWSMLKSIKLLLCSWVCVFLIRWKLFAEIGRFYIIILMLLGSFIITLSARWYLLLLLLNFMGFLLNIFVFPLKALLLWLLFPLLWQLKWLNIRHFYIDIFLFSYPTLTFDIDLWCLFCVWLFNLTLYIVSPYSEKSFQ